MEWLDVLEPWMIPIVVMVCVTLIVAITTTGSIIKTKMKQNSNSQLAGNREFLDALREFKEKTDRRLSNLEAIASGGRFPDSPEKSKKKKVDGNPLKIEMESREEDREESQKNDGLRNMLKQ